MTYCGTLKWAIWPWQYCFTSSGYDAFARLGHDPGGDDFAVLGVGQPGDGDLGDRRMTVQELLDLGRVDVLAAANDQLLAPADDSIIAVVAAAGQVAGMEPAVGVDRLACRLGIIVIAGHHAMAAARTTRPFRRPRPRRDLPGGPA